MSTSPFDRLSLIKVSSAVAGGALLMPSAQSAVGQAPAATPVDLPAVIESSAEGVPNASTARC